MSANYIYLFASIFLGACGQVLLKYGVNQLGRISLAHSELFRTLFGIFTNLWIDTGIVFFVTSMVLWIKVISTMELSKAYPSVSLSYLIVFLFSIVLFHETVTVDKIMGVFLVAAGVYFLNI